MPLSGSLTLSKVYNRSLSGVLDSTGELGTGSALSIFLNGVLSFSGIVGTTIANISLSGILGNWLGILTLAKNGIPISTGTVAGMWLGRFRKFFMDKGGWL